MGLFQSQMQGVAADQARAQFPMSQKSRMVPEGLSATTRIATPYGWRAASSLSKGCDVLAQDGSLSTVRAVSHHALPVLQGAAHPNNQLVHLPQGAVGNQQPMTLMAMQRILLPIEYMGPYQEERGILVTACDLAGLNGVGFTEPDPDETIVVLSFGSARGIMSGQGALLWCGGVDARLPHAIPCAQVYHEIEAGSFQDQFPGANAQHLLNRAAAPWL